MDLETAITSLHSAESAVALRNWPRAWPAALTAEYVSRRRFLAEFEAPWIDDRRQQLDVIYERALACYAEACLGIGGTEVPAAERAARRLLTAMVLAAVAALQFGLLPWESVALAWTALALVAVIAVFGPPLQWPAWMMAISPFTQTPKLPGRGGVGRAAAVAVRDRAGAGRGLPGRPAAARHRRPGSHRPGPPALRRAR